MTNNPVQKNLAELLDEARAMISRKDRNAIDLLNEIYNRALLDLDMHHAAFALLAKANYCSLISNDTDTALQFLTEAFEIIDEDDESAMAHYEAGLGVVHHLKGNIAEAQKNYQSSIKRLESIENKTAFDLERLPTLYYNNFILFSYSEELFGNIEHLSRAIELYKQAGNKRGVVNCLTGLANHYHNRLQEHDAAITTIMKAYEMAKELGDPSSIGGCCNNAGLYLARSGKFEESLMYLNEAKKMFAQVDNAYQTGSAYHQTGLAYLCMQRYTDAIEEFKMAEKIYSENGIQTELDKLPDLMAEAYFGMRDFENAFLQERKFRLSIAAKANNDRLNVLAQAKNKFETEMKEIEAELLRKKNEEIKRYVHKLEMSNNELNQFAHVASHDLREPLRMISSYMMLLQKSLKENISEQQKEFFGFAMDGAKRMEILISDLLRLAKVDANPKLEEVKLPSVMEEIKLNLDTLLKEKKAEINYGALPVITADRTQIIQLFQNLIGNGIKYNESKNPVVRIKSVKKKEEIEITIADNGIGIPEAYRDKVFQIFQRVQTEKKYSGSGIGLTICKKIVDSLNGKIRIEENPTGGTIFRITFPLTVLIL